MKLFINELEVKEFKLGKIDHLGKFVDCFINSYAACHKIPKSLFDMGGAVKTGGNIYKVIL